MTRKREVAQPRPGFTLENIKMQTITAIPYDIIKEVGLAAEFQFQRCYSSVRVESAHIQDLAQPVAALVSGGSTNCSRPSAHLISFGM